MHTLNEIGGGQKGGLQLDIWGGEILWENVEVAQNVVSFKLN